MKKPVKIRCVSCGQRVYELGSSFGSELKVSQAENFLTVRMEASGRECFHAYRSGGLCMELLESFLGPLRCPLPLSPGTDPLQGFCLNRWYLHPKVGNVFNSLNVGFSS